MKLTQRERLEHYLKAHQKVTPLDAWNELGIYRLSARIHELRRAGMNIVRRSVRVRNRYGEPVTVARYEMA